MRSPPRIAILIHERDPSPHHASLSIWHLAEVWKEWGYQVQVVRGVRQAVADVDLLIPQVDLTKTPEAYVRYAERFERVVNRRMTDTSKRRISTNLLTRDARFDGPVIVKTDRNAGGWPERRALPTGLSLLSRLRSRLTRALGGPLWHARALRPTEYAIFEHLHEVPQSVWSNGHLVVERFIPEREAEQYCIRICLFFGDVVLNRRVYSREPIIKGAVLHSEALPAPPALLAFRERMGFDYGKIDYVMHQGEVHILDANRSPGVVAAPDVQARISRSLAAGISSLLPTHVPETGP